MSSPLPDRQDNDGLDTAVERHLRRYFEAHGNALPPAGLYARVLREVELPLLMLALEATDGNQIQAARLLGLNRNTLRKKMCAHGIDPQRFRRT